MSKLRLKTAVMASDCGNHCNSGRWRLLGGYSKGGCDDQTKRLACDVMCAFRSTLTRTLNSQIEDERAAKSMDEYTKLCIPKLQDLLNMHTHSQLDCDAQVAGIESILQRHRVALSRIFQYYWLVVRCCALT